MSIQRIRSRSIQQLLFVALVLFAQNSLVLTTAASSTVISSSHHRRRIYTRRDSLAFAAPVSHRASKPKPNERRKKKSLPSKPSSKPSPKSKPSPRKSTTADISRSSPKSKQLNNIVNPKQQTPSLQAQLDYARNGHCVLRGLLDANTVSTKIRQSLVAHAQQQELSAWQQKVEVILGTTVLQSCHSVQDCRRVLDRHFGGHYELPFLQFFNSWRSLADTRQLCEALAPTGAQLMDVQTVRLYQDSLFWKRPGDGPTPWHADARMAPFDTNHMVTLWIPLHDLTNDDDSALVFCSKSHADFALPYWHPLPGNEEEDTGSESNKRNNKKEDSEWLRLEDRYGGDEDSLVSYLPLSAGDVTAHAGWTLHCADPAAKERIALAITFVDGQAPVRTEAVKAAKRAASSAATTTATANTNSGDRGDGEDAWSYREWLAEVPPRKRGFHHKLVPIIWPRKKGGRNNSS